MSFSYFSQYSWVTKGMEGFVKLNTVHRFLVTHKVDIFAFTETNTCWKVIPYNLQLPQRTQGLVGNGTVEFGV